MAPSLIKDSFEWGGSVHPLLIDGTEIQHLSLCNPSILELEKDNKYLINLRWVSYYLHHCENKQKYQTPWGPLCYVRPDEDPYLRTQNYICDLNLDEFSIQNPRLIDDSLFDPPEPWEFVGLEDIKLSCWNNKIYGSGVRRFAPNGMGRMQMSELKISDNKAIEIERNFIEAPVDKFAYCEKNWMPIIDQPYRFIKWCSPLEVVEADTNQIFSDSKFCHSKVVALNSERPVPNHIGARGGSQVIPYKGYYIAAIHEVDGWHNQKNDRDAFYFHRFIVWDKDWNFIKASDRFTFMHGRIEFSCGMASFKDDFLITFGFQDNSAYLFKMPKKQFDTIMGL